MSLVTRQQFTSSAKPQIIKGATVYGIPLPLKVKDSIVATPHNLRIEGQRQKINELLDSREIAAIGVKEPAKEIPVYSVKVEGQIRPLLFQLAMLEQRVIVDLKTSKLPAKVDSTAFQDKVMDITYSLGLNSFANVASNMLPVQYAVMHSLMLSSEFMELRNQTSLEHDTFTTFSPLPGELLDIYALFAYRSIELILRYRNLIDAATNANIKMQQYAEQRKIDLLPMLDVVHEKLAQISKIQEKFELKDALENLQGTNGLPKLVAYSVPNLLPDEVLSNQANYPNQELVSEYKQSPDVVTATWTNATEISLYHQKLTGMIEFPSPEVDIYLPENWRNEENKVELMQQALMAYLDELTTEDTEQSTKEEQQPQLNTELIQATTEQTVNECKNHTALDNLINQLTGIEKFDKADRIIEFLSDEAKQDVGAVTLKERKAAMIAWLNSVKTTEQ